MFAISGITVRHRPESAFDFVGIRTGDRYRMQVLARASGIGTPTRFDGTWSAYPRFESGAVENSSRREGLFIVKPMLRPLTG